MNKYLVAAAAGALTAGSAYAGGIDRSGQGVNILFEEGNYFQFTFSHANPSATGTNPIANSNDVLKPFNGTGFGYKHELTDRLDIALLYGQPFGAHVEYTDGLLSAAEGPLPFNGLAEIDSDAFTALLQYDLGNGFSIHGGARALAVDGVIQSSLGVLSADSSYDFGGVLGVAYEKPEIALRVALTYSTAIDVSLDGTRSFPPIVEPADRSFDVEFPESVNLDFQTGIAPKTLLFGSIRWVGWDGFSLDTVDGQWVNFTDDTVTYSLGVGRQITDKLSLALRFGYESPGDRPSTTALAPTTGSRSVGLGGTYQVNEKLSISAGVTYSELGDQFVDLSSLGAPPLDFKDSDAWGAGFRIGYSF